MFALGRTLRDARVRRGLEFAQVSAETRIRTRYLRALEEERFELIPGSVYAKGFLRAYADYLGLDGQLFLDEYNTRFSVEETLPAPSQLKLRPRPLRSYVVAATIFLVVLAGASLAWQLSRSSARNARSRVTSTTPVRAPLRATPFPAAHSVGRTDKPATAALVLRATRGPCWLSVYQQSDPGRHLFEGTLEPGDSRRFGQRPLWLRIGAPWNLVASRGGRRLSLPQKVATVLVTARGIRTVALR
jgi:Helix-turn-helix domain/RodZ C-terminal domain